MTFLSQFFYLAWSVVFSASLVWYCVVLCCVVLCCTIPAVYGIWNYMEYFTIFCQ